MVRDSKAVQIVLVTSILIFSSLAHGKGQRPDCITDNYIAFCESVADICKARYEDVRPLQRRGMLQVANCIPKLDNCQRDMRQQCRCYSPIDGSELENCAND